MIQYDVIVVGGSFAGLAAALYLGRARGSVCVLDTGQPRNRFVRALYVAHCASCHGEYLQGQPDWMRRLPNGRLPAPPHDETGHTWHHSDRQLLTIVRDGLAAIAPGYQSDMPAFAGVLADAQIMEVLHYIKGTWPARARVYQTACTAADPS